MCCIINHVKKPDIPANFCSRPGPVPCQRVCHFWADAVYCEGLGLYPIKGFVTRGQMLYTVKAWALYPVKGFVTHVQGTGAGNCDLANSYS